MQVDIDRAKIWGQSSETDGPLWRVRVIDLTHARAGPTCVRQLTDWGAQAIKIERSAVAEDVATGGRHESDFQNLHRNKRSLTLNLKAPEGLAIFKKLAKTADVIVENFRTGVKDRLGINYDAIKAINPRIIYASLSGFGDSGPYADRPGVDQIAQGMGGLMSITGHPEQGPMRVGIPICDLTAGIFLGHAISMALYERELSGQGQWVKTSLLSAMIQMLDFQATRWTVDGEVPPQVGNDHPTGVPTGVFKTKNGHINIAAAGNKMVERLQAVLGYAWLDDPDFATSAARRKNRHRMNSAIELVTLTKTSEEWIDLLNTAGVPAGPIYALNEMFADPQVKELNQIRPVYNQHIGKHLNLLGQGTTMSRTPWSLRQASPDAGEHTDEVLTGLGISSAEIKKLRDSQIV